MRITVELPEDEVREICEVTGIREGGPAIRKFLADSLMLQRRGRITGKFLAGEWSTELEDFEAAEDQERQSARTLSELWHG